MTTRILVLDDNETFRSMMRIALRREGYAVKLDDGTGTLDTWIGFSPDVVLCDWYFGALDGSRLLPILLGALPRAKVLVMSGGDVAEEAKQAGAHGFVMKPLGLEVLLDRIEGLLGTG